MHSILSSDIRVAMADDLLADLTRLVADFPADKIYLLTDQGTAPHCLPQLQTLSFITPDRTLTIASGDDHKNIDTANRVWNFLSQKGADRKSLLINLGGGVVCDLGGFCAATFKRGIAFINIPTTLLAQVDASVGGKTGINSGGLKNEIGVFALPHTVLIDINLLHSLDTPNLISGFAEMIKHALIEDAPTWETLQHFKIDQPHWPKLQQLVADSIRIKNHFVENDPKEQNIRKALNFGHTIGHAYETLALYRHKPVLHGYAVAFGMIGELYLSHLMLNLPLAQVEATSAFLLKLYGPFELDESAFDTLLEYMQHDKKNDSNRINFTLLPAIGQIEINQYASPGQIREALHYCLKMAVSSNPIP